MPTSPMHRSEQFVRKVEELRRSRPERALALLEKGFADASRGLDASGRGALWRLRGHVLRGLRRRKAMEMRALASMPCGVSTYR